MEDPRHFSEVWEDRDESDNFAQKHDVSLAKDKVRPSVVEQIRKQVGGEDRDQSWDVDYAVVLYSRVPDGTSLVPHERGLSDHEDLYPRSTIERGRVFQTTDRGVAFPGH